MQIAGLHKSFGPVDVLGGIDLATGRGDDHGRLDRGGLVVAGRTGAERKGPGSRILRGASFARLRGSTEHMVAWKPDKTASTRTDPVGREPVPVHGFQSLPYHPDAQCRPPCDRLTDILAAPGANRLWQSRDTLRCIRVHQSYSRWMSC